MQVELVALARTAKVGTPATISAMLSGCLIDNWDFISSDGYFPNIQGAVANVSSVISLVVNFAAVSSQTLRREIRG